LHALVQVVLDSTNTNPCATPFQPYFSTSASRVLTLAVSQGSEWLLLILRLSSTAGADLTFRGLYHLFQLHQSTISQISPLTSYSTSFKAFISRLTEISLLPQSRPFSITKKTRLDFLGTSTRAHRMFARLLRKPQSLTGFKIIEPRRGPVATTKDGSCTENDQVRAEGCVCGDIERLTLHAGLP